MQSLPYEVIDKTYLETLPGLLVLEKAIVRAVVQGIYELKM